MSKKITWTTEPVKAEGYYYYSGYSGRTLGIIYFEDGVGLLPGDQRSVQPIKLPEPPVQAPA